MVINSPSMLFLLVFSAGCGLLMGEREVERAPDIATPAQVVEEKPVEAKPVSPAPSVKVKDDTDHGKAIKPSELQSKSLTQADIRRVQVKLKASGFDPGPIDGILGPKTKSAFLNLQSSCLALLGVADFAEEQDVEFNPVTEVTALSAPNHETLSQEDIRRIQTRLKQSGFDPGPLDGIFGPKTREAMLRTRAGCSFAKQMAFKGEARLIAGKRASPTVILTRQISTAESDSSSPTDLVDGQDNSPSLARDNSARIDEIRMVQMKLTNAGFDPGPIDGIMGPRTRSALQRYRASNGSRNAPVPALGSGSGKEY